MFGACRRCAVQFAGGAAKAARGVPTLNRHVFPSVALQPRAPLRSFASGEFLDSWVEPDDLLTYLDSQEEEKTPGGVEDARFEMDIGKRNHNWRRKVLKEQPDLFDNIGKGQAPQILWIGCCDSRVAPENLVDASPGEIFVHRNIANLVVATDTNLRSVLQYAVDYLKVQHIIVCGHYDCGGVKASVTANDHRAPLESWLANVRDVYRLHREELDTISDRDMRHKRMVELNVIEQCLNLWKTGDLQRNRAATASADKASFPRVHAMVFSPEDGILRRLNVDFRSYMKEFKNVYNLYDATADREMWASYHGAPDSMSDVKN